MEERDAPQDADSPAELGRRLDTLLGQSSWEVDAIENNPEVVTKADLEPVAEATALTPPVPDVPPPLPRILEALLFVGGPPLTAARAAEAIRGLTEAQFLQAIETLGDGYRRQGRPFAIQPQGDGYVLGLRPRYRPVLEKLYGGVREARLSPAAIDVLALIAYRQPATKQEVDSIRGAESGAILRQLVRRGLIAVVHRGEAEQREVSYGTTPKFLEFFGLSALDDLPQTQDMEML